MSFSAHQFESFVNSERCKTKKSSVVILSSLRALLIQKDVKRWMVLHRGEHCLRALLIQKDVKLVEKFNSLSECLRALLIQKDVKQASY